MSLRFGGRWRRRLLLASFLVLLIFGLAIALLHTPSARRWMFARLQAQLRDSQALLLDGDQFDYNLFVPWVQLDNVSLHAFGPGGVTPFIKADRAHIRLSFWSLMQGSPTARQVKIEGLAIRWLIDKEGRSNLPRIEGVS